MAPTDSSSLVACMSRRRSSIVSPLIINKSMDDLSSCSTTRPDSPAVTGFKRVPKKFKPTLQIVIPENQLELNNAAAMSAVSTDGVQPVPQDSSSSDKNSSDFYSSSTRYGNGRGSFRKQIDVSIYIPRRLGGGYAMF
ncbi:hypothetical protein HDU77_000528 [Chytriomyces hyalinus]|nr:hypothetical protein HDU77_000528 [Chytriomyces hyalinus]